MSGKSQCKWPLMTVEELHKFGVDLILPALSNEHFVIEQVSFDITVDPQVAGKRWGLPAFVMIRTACYPDTGALSDDEIQMVLRHSSKTGRIACVANVGLSCMQYPDKSEVTNMAHRGLPIRNGGFWCNYKGLLVLQDADRVAVLGSAGGSLSNIAGDKD